jgi:hypothetical protein
MDGSYESTYRSVKKANKWVAYAFISLLITSIISAFNGIKAIGGKTIYSLTGIDITQAARAEESNTALIKFTSIYSEYGVKLISNDYYIHYYKNAKFKKSNGKDNNTSDNSFVYYYDDKGNVIFTLVTADLIRNYYYLVPGKFTSYDGLQLYRMVEQENK